MDKAYIVLAVGAAGFLASLPVHRLIDKSGRFRWVWAALMGSLWCSAMSFALAWLANA